MGMFEKLFGPGPYKGRYPQMEEIAVALGRVCITFQALEEVITASIVSFGTPRKLLFGMIMSSELSFRVKINVLFSLASEVLEESDLGTLEPILARCFALEQKRNTVTHSSYGINDYTAELVRKKRTSKHKKGYRLSREKIDAPQIHDLAIEITACCDELIKFMRDKCGNDFAIAFEILWNEQSHYTQIPGIRGELPSNE